MNAKLVQLLVCPLCKGELTLADDSLSLCCFSCNVAYPLQDGIPVLLETEAIPLLDNIKCSS